MISRLRGKVVACSDGLAEVQVGGIAYAVRVLQSPDHPMEPSPDEVEFLIHHSGGAEGSPGVLYGFLLEAERAMFRRLLRVGRLGPSKALQIMEQAGRHSRQFTAVAWLEDVIARGDAAALEELKGVGEKLAKLICIQLGPEPESKGRKSKGRKAKALTAEAAEDAE